MKDKILLDTNVMVYLFDKPHIEKNDIARKLFSSYLIEDNFFLSTQVLGEMINVLLRKYKSNFPVDDIETFIRVLPERKILTVEPLCYAKALEIHKRYGFSFWDSLIISTAINNNCTLIYSEDMQHHQMIDNVTIINPFKELV